jgi:hypothetical protein
MAGPEFEGDWKGMSSEDVWGWYFRLAAFMEKQSKQAGVEDPLSPRFLVHFLQGKGAKLTFDPPKHLQQSKYIQQALLAHREIYLSRKKLKGNVVGILKRGPVIVFVSGRQSVSC